MTAHETSSTDPADPITPSGGPRSRDGALANGAATDVLWVFSVLWALAAWFHQMGNARGAADVPHLLLVAAIVAVLARPGRLVPLVALSATGFWTAWTEAPMLSNHWTLFSLVNLGLLGSLAATRLRTPSGGTASFEARFASNFLPVARTVLLAFYLFAAFAKLNSAFFDRTVSCAVYFFDESMTSIGLGGLGLQDQTAIQTIVIVGTAMIELSVPWLLMIRRTRNWGVVVAIVFHAALAIDKSSHQFVDFSSLLTALFVLFLPVGLFTWVRSFRVPAMPIRPGLLAAVPIALIALAGFGSETATPTARTALTVMWWVWQPLVVALVVVLVRYLRTTRPEPIDSVISHVGFGPPAWLWIVPGLAVLNGITPYVELKTAYGWTMYSNLSMVDGETNHLIVRAGFPLTEEQSDVVSITASSDPRLGFYARHDLLLPRTELRIFIADNPDTALTYSHGGETYVTERAGDDPLLNEPVPIFRRKLQVFRSMSLTSPEVCQPLWGAAR